MAQKIMTLLRAKTRAWATHLLLSVLVLLPVFLLVYFWWFPGPFFEAQDTAKIVWLLVGVDLVLGPVLTFVVYKPAKKSLKFDLSVIVLLQVAALAYGLWSIYSERPAFVVYAVDRYEVLAKKDITFAAAGLDGFKDPEGSMPSYAFAEMPLGEAFSQFQDSVLFGGQPDLERRPEFWIPHVQGRDAILSRAGTVGELIAAFPESAPALERAAARQGTAPEDTRYVPLVAKAGAFAAILDPETARVEQVVAVPDPWLD